ncbi:glycoside hydrolase N-terminal domain-containing protein [Pseudactinotalea sp. HY158]|uniref:glycoside hydrolase family 95 protein n=1 Tax=Pseudactinotalea sp. HY158 TaxID=2654547 RepID=UPI0018925A9C|nr:glycoside hydrolase family 95 protein [Pseudactinotalea sp. HY158]
MTMAAGMLVATAGASLADDGPDAPAQSQQNLLWFDEPAPVDTDRNQWQSTVLPIGNGYMGGLVFGGVQQERIHFNDKTLWSGGPAESRPDYNGSNRTTPVTRGQLTDFAEQLDDKSTDVFGLPFDEANRILTREIIDPSAWKNGMGMYQDFGDIRLDFGEDAPAEGEVEDYIRDLDLETAIAGVSYTAGGVAYEREVFTSYPDNVLAVRLSADEAASITVGVSLDDAQRAGSTSVSGDTITLAGALRDNQLQYEAQVKVVADGGQVARAGDGLQVTGADTVTLYLATGTDYENDYPTYRGDHPHEPVTERVTGAAAKGYEAVRADHVADHAELFSRVQLDLGQGRTDLPTDERIQAYRDGGADPALEALLFQFGRYLTIATSREGTLPSNLNGVWMIGSGSQFWNADYHFNVNVQMNYWPNLVTNLAETAVPFNDYMESLREPGRVTAGATSASPSGPGEENGFIVHTVNNIFGLTAPYAVQEFGWNIGGSTWAMQNVGEYYKFTQDREYLREEIYPMQREMADFWLDYLWYSEYQDRLVVTPSVSAEQGPTVNGSTYDQSLVWELFEDAIDSATELGVDEELAQEWRAAQARLDPIMIGEAGQIKEWYEETTPGRAQAGDLAEVDIPNFNAGYRPLPHRHLSHLVGLYPGTLLSKEDPAELAAARVSLEERGFESTGWGKAHRINLWARALDAEGAYRALTSMVGTPNGYAGIMDNLLDSHGQGTNHDERPVFQIEGNMGLTAGIAEMLIQSHLDRVQLLPALPDEWADGSIAGIKARGDFELDYRWQDSRLVEATIESGSGQDLLLENPGLADFVVLDGAGDQVALTERTEDTIGFETEAGQTYRLVRAHDLTVEAGDGGAVSVAGAPAAGSYEGRVPDGAQVALVAEPESGFAFDRWVDEAGAEVSADAEYAVTVAEDTYRRAEFVAAPEPTPTDPEPTDPAPTDPVPTDPAPTDPAPTDSSDPAPTEPAPTGGADSQAGADQAGDDPADTLPDTGAKVGVAAAVATILAAAGCLMLLRRRSSAA